MATKPVLVLLHGLGGSKADWAGVSTPLSRSHRVVALDLPGAGAEAKPASGYDPASLARWLGDALEARGLPSVRLAGHSLGARVAGELAALQPARVEALALVSPLGAVSYTMIDRLKWKAMSRRSVLASVPESSMRSASGYGFAVDGPGKKGFVERALASRTGKEGAAVARAVEGSVDGILQARPLAERLKGTKMPLLVVAGALDPLAPPAESRKILEARPDASFVELEGLGHYPLLEDPKRLAKTLGEFLKRL